MLARVVCILSNKFQDKVFKNQIGALRSIVNNRHVLGFVLINCHRLCPFVTLKTRQLGIFRLVVVSPGGPGMVALIFSVHFFPDDSLRGIIGVEVI